MFRVQLKGRKMTDLEVDDLVVVAGYLGQIQKINARINRAKGYIVWDLDRNDPSLGSLPHFAQDFQVKRAVIGVNVCDKPKYQHFCGLLHVSDFWLKRLEGTNQGNE